MKKSKENNPEDEVIDNLDDSQKEESIPEKVEENKSEENNLPDIPSDQKNHNESVKVRRNGSLIVGDEVKIKRRVSIDLKSGRQFQEYLRSCILLIEKINDAKGTVDLVVKGNRNSPEIRLKVSDVYRVDNET